MSSWKLFIVGYFALFYIAIFISTSGNTLE